MRENLVYVMEKIALKRIHLKNKFCELAFTIKIVVYLNIFLGI